VIFPGFTELGIETASAATWLDSKLGTIKR